MSNSVFLLFGLLCTFGAVLLVGVAVDFSISKRRQTVQMLEAQVGPSTVRFPNLRDEDLSRSFFQRALVPVVAAAGRAARRVTPIGARERYAHKLLLAGSPAGWDAERVAAFKIIGGVGALIGSLVLASTLGLAGLKGLSVLVLFTFAGFFAPDVVLARRVDARQREVRRALPDTLDLLTISVEAGLSLNAAIGQVVHNVPGVLSRELARMLQEIQLGVPRSDAFKSLAERTDVEELNGFVLAMVQAESYGVSVSNVLRAQSRDLRIRRRQRAQEEAQKTPVKIVFPLVVCILPSLFVIVAGPGAIRIMQAMFHTGA